jgi:hypothetical protein
MGMIQTESPYYQPDPPAAKPFVGGIFSGDPLFTDCAENPKMCAMSYGLLLVQSQDILIYGAGLYSWFSDYDQGCLSVGCQQRIAGVQSSSNIWLYNVATKGVVEMVSPMDGDPTLAADNQNGYLSSIIAWLQGSDSTVGGRNFTGFAMFEESSLDELDISPVCRNALYQTIYCDDAGWNMRTAGSHVSSGNNELTDRICDAGCRRSLTQVHSSIQSLCQSSPELIPGLPTIATVDRLWWVYNDTCLKDVTTGKYCNGECPCHRQVWSYDD